MGRPRILVIDDERALRETIADTLRMDGHDVQTAADGTAGLELIGRNPFDVILSDLRMPEMDGRVLYDHIGCDHPQALKRIVFVTAQAWCLDYGAFLRRRGPRCSKSHSRFNNSGTPWNGCWEAPAMPSGDVEGLQQRTRVSAPTQRATRRLMESIVRQSLRERQLAHCFRCVAAGSRSPDLRAMRAALLTLRQRPGFRVDRCLCGAPGVKYRADARHDRPGS